MATLGARNTTVERRTETQLLDSFGVMHKYNAEFRWKESKILGLTEECSRTVEPARTRSHFSLEWPIRPRPPRPMHFQLGQNLRCWANLQDHMRNDVAVRSIPGSVVL